MPKVEWNGVGQLLKAYMPFTDNWFSEATIYSGDNKTETVLLVDKTSFSSSRFCFLDFWLIDRKSESELFKRVGKRISSEPNYTIIAEVVAFLDWFPNHKVALTLSSVSNID